MAKTRKIPLRKSVVSGEVIDKRDLLRIVKNKEGEIFLFDYETPETEVLAPNFIEFLNQILQNPKPILQELKSWEKKMYKMK